MRTFKSQKGFTLVELAIVMTIIGLLIGGILKGQELIRTARVTATIAQVRAYESAVTTFRDTYNALPGDLTNGNGRIPGCSNITTGCNANATGGGNGVVGTSYATWGAITPQATTNGNAAVTANTGENYLFWGQLAMANLITDVSDVGMRNATARQFGITDPSARIGGGFEIATVSGAQGTPTGTVAASTQTPAGLILIMTGAPTGTPVGAAATMVVTPGLASQIDRKIDDGNPGAGYALAHGSAAAAAAGNATACVTTATPPAYNEGVGGTNCGMIFRIQG